MRLFSIHHGSLKMKGQIVCHGDSITEALSEDESQRWPTVAAAAINDGRCDYRNEGTSGYTVFQLNAEFASVITPLFDARRHFNIAILSGGTNDLVGGGAVDGAGLIARAQTWETAALSAGFTPFFMTLLDRQMGVGPPNQTTFNTARATYNVWARTKRCFDAAALPEAQDASNPLWFKEPPGGNGTHPTPALLALMGARCAADVMAWFAAGSP